MTIGDKQGNRQAVATKCGMSDSGASHHMSGDRRIFREVRWHLPMKLATAEGEMAAPAYVADFHSNGLGFGSGLYHSESTEFLTSIRRLNRQKVSVTFDDEGQALFDTKTGTAYLYPARQGES